MKIGTCEKILNSTVTFFIEKQPTNFCIEIAYIVQVKLCGKTSCILRFSKNNRNHAVCIQPWTSSKSALIICSILAIVFSVAIFISQLRRARSVSRSMRIEFLIWLRLLKINQSNILVSNFDLLKIYLFLYYLLKKFHQPFDFHLGSG